MGRQAWTNNAPNNGGPAAATSIGNVNASGSSNNINNTSSRANTKNKKKSKNAPLLQAKSFTKPSIRKANTS
jgi:hypothetical protein